MKTLTLLFVLLSAPAAVAYAQDAVAPEGAVIDTAEVSGFPISQLSPGLRQAVDALVGQPLNHAAIGELADRIEAERPEHVAAVRMLPRPNGHAQVIFLVARISDNHELAENINARYIVASVSIDGVPEERLSQGLRDDLQKLVGNRLDQDDAQRLADRIKAELPEHSVGRRISRAAEPGKILVVFEIRKIEPPDWIRFTPSRSKYLYQQDLGWTGVFDIPIGGPGHSQFNIGGIFEDKDELLEVYRGYRLRFESTKLGTRALGAGLEFSSLDETWDDRTLVAIADSPAIPAAYRARRSIDPRLTFAVNPHVRFSGGWSTTELLPRTESGVTDSQMASAATFSAGYDQRWRPDGRGSHRVDANYGLRSASTGLNSDSEYTRHSGDATYRFNHRRNEVIARFSFGHISGRAPLFERFSLGNTTTLRGWNKFDVAPAGGQNMFHQSVEYRFRSVLLFLDTGSVWDPGTRKTVRYSTGLGFDNGHVFLTWGVPLNADSVSSTFMLGVRF